MGIGSLVAALAGFVTLIIAHNLALGGDTMEMMRAVLDTNFWLATHVVTVTIGYAATFVAGFLAIIYILRGRVHHHARTPATGHSRWRHGLWHRLLRHALQLRRHRAGRHLGRPILGPVLGLGPEGKRRPAHRALERRSSCTPAGAAWSANAA